MTSRAINDSTDGFAAGSLADRWSDLRQRLAGWRQARRERAQMTRELLSYSDRELDDLAISRSDIPAIVAGTYRRS
jgi:uncharacterized protein YjiS (DUF1127 family)